MKVEVVYADAVRPIEKYVVEFTPDEAAEFVEHWITERDAYSYTLEKLCNQLRVLGVVYP